MSGSLIGHLKSFLHLPSTNDFSQNRKRRVEETSDPAASLTKYRRVSNNFPAFKTPFDDDQMDAVNRNRSRQTMANGQWPEFLKQNRKPAINYADVEFSDDEDELVLPFSSRSNVYENAQPSGSGMSRNMDFPSTSYSNFNGRPKKIPNLIKIPHNLMSVNGHSSSTEDSVVSQSHKNLYTTQTQQKPGRDKSFYSKLKSLGSTKQSSAQSIITQNINLTAKRNYQQLLEKLVPNLFKGKAVPEVQQPPKPKRTNYIETIVIDDDVPDNRKPVSFNRRSLLSSTLIDEEKPRVTSPKEVSRKALSPESIQKRENETTLKLPERESVNSLKDRFENRQAYQQGHELNIIKNYESNSLRRKELIEEEEKKSRELNKSTIERERSISDSFKDFHITSKIFAVDEEEEEEIDEYPELTQEQVNKINYAVRGGAPSEVIINKFNISITRQDLTTLVGDSWLNDEVINFYMNLLMDRSEQEQENGRPSVYAMNTFFIPKLLQSGHAGLRRWTRKVDIFAHDIIPVPVHVGQVHWCMAIIHLKNKTIKYYDSMGHPNFRVLDALEQYLKDESMDKKKIQFDMSDWSKECVRDCPRQMNGSDCGVFSCMFAEFICRDSNISFSQQHMPYFRNKMIYEIATGKLILQ